MLNTTIKQRSPLSSSIRRYALITRLSGFMATRQRTQTNDFIGQARGHTRRDIDLSALSRTQPVLLRRSPHQGGKNNQPTPPPVKGGERPGENDARNGVGNRLFGFWRKVQLITTRGTP